MNARGSASLVRGGDAAALIGGLDDAVHSLVEIVRAHTPGTAAIGPRGFDGHALVLCELLPVTVR